MKPPFGRDAPTHMDFPCQYDGGSQAKVQEGIPTWTGCRKVILTQTKPLLDIYACVTPNLSSLNTKFYVSQSLWI